MIEPELKPSTYDAYRLLHEGAIALAQVESNGIRIDERYLNHTIEETAQKARDLTRELKADKIWKLWKKEYGEDTNLQSDAQLVHILFDLMKLPYDEVRFGRTEKTRRMKADKKVILSTELPFCKKYIERKELIKARVTYLEGLRSEVVDGLFHPTFNLHLASTFRSSSGRDKNEDRVSRDFNFQNVPSRNKQMAEAIRKCFIPRKGRRLAEPDYSGVEVKVAACYTKDPTLINYINDPTTDMHRDTAMKLFMLTKEQVEKKTTRDWSKNRWVFPQFYGSCYFQCAPHIWEACSDEQYKLPNSDVSILAHLKKNGIKELGKCDPKERPVPGTFEYHCKKIEEWMWQEQYPVYTKWKKDTYTEYCRTGKLNTLTGFTLEGLFRRNVVLNVGIQGGAFHLLLWSLTRIQELLIKHKFKTKLVGQIHDCLVADVVESELDDFLNMVVRVMTVECPKHFRWVNVPLGVEAEVTPINGSWFSKQVWEQKDGKWQLPVKK